MDRELAIRILGIDEDFDTTKLKKKYRQLMHKVHPDNGESVNDYEYSAQEINEAYTFIKSQTIILTHKEARRKETERKHWNAPINQNAIYKRKVYDAVYDMEGTQIGLIDIAEDKYIWILDEEFKLFLKSMYTLSKELLDEIDSKLGREATPKYDACQAKLAYLLAGQYVDSTRILYDLELDIDNGKEADIFYIAAMLELNITSDKDVKKIYPMKVSNHRLYVMDEKCNEVGYISFKDDRLSFAITPLFSQKDVMIKLEIPTKQKKTNKRYLDVDLWIKIPLVRDIVHMDSTGLHIEKLLKDYEESY